MPKSSTAVIERPRRDPSEIAAAVAAAAQAAAADERRKDVARWRELCTAIADGHEPDGAALAAIGIVSARLQLPEGSLAKHVAAIQLDRKLSENAANALEVGKAAEAEMAALGKRVRAAEQTLADLRSAAYLNILDQQNQVYQQVRVDEHRAAHPVLFSEF